MKEQYIKIDEDGNKFYYSSENMVIIHREDGPAIEYTNGDKLWYNNGLLHREDGHAIECANGYKEWWINGNKYTEEEFLNFKKARVLDFYSCLNPDFHITIPF